MAPPAVARGRAPIRRPGQPSDSPAGAHRPFEERAARWPDAVAVVSEGRASSYRALNRSANRLARHLRRRGVGQGSPVAVCVGRSLELPTSLLAVAKAGGCYVPVDPADPPDRVAAMLAAAGADLVLTTGALLDEHPAMGRLGATVVALDADRAEIAQLAAHDLDVAVRPDDLLYVLCTSGSTGTPKGVGVPHRALQNLVAWQQLDTPVRRGARTLQLAPATFDVATQELLATLSHGGTLVLVPEAVRHDPHELLRVLAAESIDRLFTPVVILRRIAEVAGARRPAQLRDVITAGEQLLITPKVRDFFRDGACRLHNQYGPTETHVVTSYTLTGDVDEWPALPPIGRAIANVGLAILDDRLDDVPVGTPGELYVGGPCLARGYVGDAELTTARFVEHPRHGRIYRTGDVVSERPDGDLEFLGRLDAQVKIRGYRVETGEIEALLAQHPAVGDAVVVPTELSSGDRRLAAYVVPTGAATPDSATAEEALVEEWRAVWDAVYGAPAEGSAAKYPGWRSSATGRPLPEADMEEWIDTTVERILAHRPDRVLEIGCGTGLLLHRIAPLCSRYVGTDLSATALDRLRGSLCALGGADVALLHAAAADPLPLAPASFDTIVLNSLVEHFPGPDYLARVLDRALGLAAPGAVVFVGDVRSLRHLEAFHASVELGRAPAATSAGELRARVDRAVARERQLLVDPEFFDVFVRRRGRAGCVDLQLRRGRLHNEMTRFRYDAAIRLDAAPVAPTESLDWTGDRLSLEAVRDRLEAARPRVLEVRGVPNARLQHEVAVVALLADGRHRTAGEIRDAAARAARPGVDPEEIWGLSAHRAGGDDALSHATRVMFSSGSLDTVDATFERATGTVELADGTGPVRSVDDRPWRVFTNRPTATRHPGRLGADLRDYLAERLPGHMVPSTFVVLERFPQTPSGKVDRRRLPDPTKTRPWLPTPMVAPRGDVERRLAHIWQEILAVDAVGVDDGFFDLGGDSLLLIEMQQRLAAHFSTDIPVTALFEHPTIRSLADSGLFGESGSVAPDRPARPGRSGTSRLGVRRRRRQTRQEAG